MNDADPPGGEPTLAYPDHVETVDLLGDKARRARDQEIDPEQRAALQAAVARDAPAEMPVKIGRYQLLEMVGAGGMGMVWGAWDPELERRVALKLVRLTTADSRERMLREGQVLARLSHPNVVPIFDVGVMGGQVYLVMEW
ncbi:MAG TPA: protein kinase, partial [Kofleriaceae bacterium]